MENTVQDSLSPVKVLLCTLFSRLKFHNEFIHTFISATTDEQSQFWSAIIALDSTLTESLQEGDDGSAPYSNGVYHTLLSE